MCLTPSEITINSGVLVIPVFKFVNKFHSKYGIHSESIYRTPYYGASVPADGVLRPNFYLRKKLKINKGIHGGVIHSFYNGGAISSGQIKFSAYALFPIAFRNSAYLEVASRALYIPALDFSDLKARRMRLLQGPDDNITIRELTRLFAFDVDLADYDEWDDYDAED